MPRYRDRGNGHAKALSVAERELTDRLHLVKEMELSKSPYTVDQRLAGVMAYITTGRSDKAGEMSAIPPSTIREWKRNAEWWPLAVSFCRRQKQDELDAVLSNVVHLAFGEVAERVEKGEVITDNKTGKPVLDKSGNFCRRPLSIKELSIAGGVAYDKRQLIRGDPTRISAELHGHSSVQQDIEDLKEQFSNMSQNNVVN